MPKGRAISSARGDKMAVHRYVNIALPEAKRLADLTGIAIDLRACREYCEKILQVYANILRPSEENKLLDCFSVYVFVKYGRCFKGGVRSKKTEKELIAHIAPNDLDLHQLVLNIRDKYIAHSVNDLETHTVQVWLSPEEDGRKVYNVNIGSQYLSCPEAQIFKRLKKLIDKLLPWIEEQKREEERRLSELVEAKFDLEVLYSLKAEIPNELDYKRVVKRRKGP